MRANAKGDMFPISFCILKNLIPNYLVKNLVLRAFSLNVPGDHSITRRALLENFGLKNARVNSSFNRHYIIDTS